MVERYFVSADILFDMVMSERPEYEVANKLLELAERGEVQLCLCTASIDEAVFVLAKYMGNETAREFIRATLESFEVFPLTEAISLQALSVEAERFVDAALIVCAEAENVDGIIVQNPTRFEAADIKIIPISSLQTTPEQDDAE